LQSLFIYDNVYDKILFGAAKVLSTAAGKCTGKYIQKSAMMKKSNREKRKAGSGNATEIAICDTPDERTLRSRQVQQMREIRK